MSETVIDLYSRAAGIDIHQALAVVSAIVPIGSDPFRCKFVRAEFDTFFEQGLKSLVEFLRPLGVEQVLMESTGVYWMAPYDALLDAGINVAIGNAHEIRGMRGRKTDRNDADYSGTRNFDKSGVACYAPPACIRLPQQPQHGGLPCPENVELLRRASKATSS